MILYLSFYSYLSEISHQTIQQKYQTGQCDDPHRAHRGEEVMPHQESPPQRKSLRLTCTSWQGMYKRNNSNSQLRSPCLSTTHQSLWESPGPSSGMVKDLNSPTVGRSIAISQNKLPPCVKEKGMA